MFPGPTRYAIANAPARHIAPHAISNHFKMAQAVFIFANECGNSKAEFAQPLDEF